MWDRWWGWSSDPPPSSPHWQSQWPLLQCVSDGEDGGRRDSNLLILLLGEWLCCHCLVRYSSWSSFILAGVCWWRCCDTQTEGGAFYFGKVWNPLNHRDPRGWVTVFGLASTAASLVELHCISFPKLKNTLQLMVFVVVSALFLESTSCISSEKGHSQCFYF